MTTLVNNLGVPGQQDSSIPVPLDPPANMGFPVWRSGAWVSDSSLYGVYSVEVVSMRQCRLALLQMGYLDEVDAYIASLPDDERRAAEIEWQYATAVERNAPLAQQVQVALGWSQQQMAELFNLAATL